MALRFLTLALAATPGRQVGIELSYDFWRHAELFVAVFSGIGQNREANNTKIAFTGKLQLRPLAFAPNGPQLIVNASLFADPKTNGFTPTLNSAFGFDFLHGIPATGTARRVATGGGLFCRTKRSAHGPSNRAGRADRRCAARPRAPVMIGATGQSSGQVRVLLIDWSCRTFPARPVTIRV